LVKKSPAEIQFHFLQKWQKGGDLPFKFQMAETPILFLAAEFFFRMAEKLY